MSEPLGHDPVAKSDYFQWREFAASASRPDLVRPVPLAFRPHVEQWVRTLGEPIRRLLARPLHVLSGYRPPALNTAIGGSPTSQHLTASAVDVTCGDIEAVFRALLARPNPYPSGQIIFYPAQRFLHLALPSMRYPVPSFHVHWPARALVYARVADVAALDALLPLESA